MVGNLAAMAKRVEDEGVRKEVGALLRRARSEKGWSQERLAEQLELDTVTVSRIETGRRSMSARVAARAAAALGVSPASILGVAEPGGSGTEDEAVRLLRAMDERHREAAIRVLREIARL